MKIFEKTNKKTNDQVKNNIIETTYQVVNIIINYFCEHSYLAFIAIIFSMVFFREAILLGIVTLGLGVIYKYHKQHLIFNKTNQVKILSDEEDFKVNYDYINNTHRYTVKVDWIVLIDGLPAHVSKLQVTSPLDNKCLFIIMSSDSNIISSKAIEYRNKISMAELSELCRKI